MTTYPFALEILGNTKTRMSFPIVALDTLHPLVYQVSSLTKNMKSLATYYFVLPLLAFIPLPSSNRHGSSTLMIWIFTPVILSLALSSLNPSFTTHQGSCDTNQDPPLFALPPQPYSLSIILFTCYPAQEFQSLHLHSA